MFHLINLIRSNRLFSRATAVMLATYIFFGLNTDFNFGGWNRETEPC